MSASDRDTLLAAALDLVAAFDVGHPTLDRITAAARLTRARFYFYFDNLEDCVTALLSKAIAILQDEVERQMQAGQGFGEALMETLLSGAEEPAAARRAVVRILASNRDYEYAGHYLIETWRRQALDDGAAPDQATLLCLAAIGILHADGYGLTLEPQLGFAARRSLAGATLSARPRHAAAFDLETVD